MTYLELEVSERWGLEDDAAYAELSQRYRTLAARREKHIQIARITLSILVAALAITVIASVTIHFLTGSAVWHIAIPTIAFLSPLAALAHTFSGKSYYEKRCALWRAGEIDAWLANKSSGASDPNRSIKAADSFSATQLQQ